MPQFDTSHFLSQGFWLCVIFAILYIANRYWFVPHIMGVYDARSRFVKDVLKESEDIAASCESLVAAMEKIESTNSKFLLDAKISISKKFKKQLNYERVLIEKKCEEEIREITVDYSRKTHELDNGVESLVADHYAHYKKRVIPYYEEWSGGG